MVMKPQQSISVADFADKVVAETPAITDLKVEPDWRFGLDEGFSLKFGPGVVSTLALYQVKSRVGGGADIGRVSSRLSAARGGDPAAAVSVATMVQHLNASLSQRPIDDGLARTYIGPSGDIEIGGVVSRHYTPVRHSDLLEAVLDSEEFREARVVKWDIEASHMQAMVMLDGTSWSVDGGLKAGMKLHNGQFGDKSYGYLAMLFRLRCTNGLMDVLGKAGTPVRRHASGSPELNIKADVKLAISRTALLADRAEIAMSTEVDVVGSLIEMCRRKIIGRGPMKAAAERRFDLGGGGSGGDNLWSLSQAVSAAARNYAFDQSQSLTELGGRLYVEGVDAVIKSAALPADAPATEELRELIPA